MQVVHLITTLRIGGAERMLEKLISRMDASHSASSIVVSLAEEGPIGARLREKGVTVYALGIVSPLALPGGVVRLIGILRRHRPDIVQTWLYHADLVGLFGAAVSGLGRRLLWNLRCSDMNLNDYRLSTRLILRLLASLSAFPAAIISNSQAGLRYHVAIGYRPRRQAVILNGFEIEQFRPDPGTVSKIRMELGIPAGARLLGMIARYDPMKDHATFVAMAERLLKLHPDLHFLLVGRGCTAETPQLEDAAKRLDGHLHLLGERNDIPLILASLDLAVLSSAYGEGFPNVLGEALAAGTPCVATDVGDVRAIVGDCGIVVPPRNATALAEAAVKLLTLPEPEAVALRQKARHRAEEHFSLEAAANQYETLYRDIAGARAS